MAKPLQCSQGHRWETSIGRQGQVLQQVPTCPLCGGSPVRRWHDWHELPWPVRILLFGLLAAIPSAAVGFLIYLLLPERLIRATFTGHAGQVTSVAFSPDGRLVVSGSVEGAVKIWRAESGQMEQTLAGHRQTVQTVAFSPDGRIVASGGRDGTVRLWSVATGKPLAVIGGADPKAVIAFAPVGTTLAAPGKAGRLIIWDYRLGVVRASWSAHAGRITCLAYAPDGETLASAGEDGNLRLWQVERFKSSGYIDFGVRLGAALAPGPLAPWRGLMVQFLDAEAPLLGSQEAPAVTAMAFASDNRTLVAGTAEGTLMIWDAVTARRQDIWQGHHRAVIAVAFAPATRMVATASAADVQLWDLAEGHMTALSSFDDFPGRITALALSAAGRALAVAKDDHTVEVWNVARLRKYDPRP
jgi:WD40 repeat protein